MEQRLRAAFAAGALVLAACNTNGAISGARSASLSTTTDTASIERGRSSYASFVAAGYHYHFYGRLSNINVGSVGGHASIVAKVGEGDHLDAVLERIPSTMFSLGPNKSPSFAQPVECADCAGGSGSAPPRSQATNPPNYGSCSEAGGATWFDQTTGNGGCLGPGSSRGFPCGTWSYASPGFGHFKSWDGLIDADGWTFISLNPDGQSCHLGY